MAVTRQQVMDCAMGLRAVTHVVQWGDSDVFKVGGKVFAICGDDGFSFKVTEIGFMALTEGGPGRQAPYLAKGQWVFAPLDDVGQADAADWLTTSHELIAAKLTGKLRAELGL